MSTGTTGILPVTQGTPGIPGLQVCDPNGNLNTQFQQGAPGGLQGAGLFAAQRYYFTTATASPTIAVFYQLPNGVLFDFDIRWSARLVSGTGVSGSGRILLCAIAISGTASIRH